LQLTQASKSPGVVSVALQLPESEGGQRLNDKFASNTSLWLV
jgi:tether containing UBX domain for GLUT4